MGEGRGRSDGGGGAGTSGRKGRGKGVGRGVGEIRPANVKGGRGGRGSGRGATGGTARSPPKEGGRSAGAPPAKGGPKAKPGDMREVAGVQLVAVERGGKLAWEPIGEFTSEASREEQRRAAAEEARWVRQREAQVREERLAEAREAERKEKARKAALLGSDSVYHRGPRSQGPLVPVPQLLQTTRKEEAAARAAGMPASAPKQYQFLKESLDAMEKKHAALEQQARQQKYESNRRRLRLEDNTGGVGDDIDGSEETNGKDLRARLASMTDEEFKALALERKRVAESELAAATAVLGKETVAGGVRAANGVRGADAILASCADGVGTAPSKPTNGRSRGRGRKVELDPCDDPDYRR